VSCKTSSWPDATFAVMGRELVTDKLWEIVEPLLPPEPPKPKGGRPRVPNRAALTGIVFVLKSGIPWEMLPKEMGCGSGATCCGACATGKRPECGASCTGCFWTAWAKLTGSTGRGRPWTRRAFRPIGGEKTGKNPTDRGKPGSKRHLMVEQRGVPLAVVLTAANVHDSNILLISAQTSKLQSPAV
jgi:transposase